MTFKLFRRGSTKCIGFIIAFLTILLLLYYIPIGQHNTLQKNSISLTAPLLQNETNERVFGNRLHQTTSVTYSSNLKSFLNPFTTDDQTNKWGDKCYFLNERSTNVTTLREYAQFEFQPEWIRTKEYWNKLFEERYELLKRDTSRPPLKVIIVPHSHNDPGWLKTFINYFQSDSRQILNLIIKKMQQYSDLTFIWSEISFLQLWWDQAHPTKQRALKRLLQSGRFEITTGGWVMTDEANVHIYPMLDQLIEGHQWLHTTLNITPKVGWSIDPFGHGSTIPYLLSRCEFEGTIIQRIHYAWKHWFAKKQYGDFIWAPYWIVNKGIITEGQFSENSLLTHNMPFDIYSIKHSCGPHPFICLNFDFRKIPGEYTEYSIKAQFISDENVEEKAELLLEQYSRTASLFPHNVALIPLGDDFRYNKELEINQQYTNYKKLIDHINANKKTYKTDISFGTPRDYFREIMYRYNKFPTLKGDFFVYSDIFSEGRPAYWSGYFTTRPFFKMLSADLEHNLRASEILFTIAYNTARKLKMENAIKVFEKNYEKIITARRNLGLFQHHDAITGTSKSAVMRDYGLRLFESIKDVVKMQESTIELLLQKNAFNRNFLLSELERDNFNILPRKTPISIEDNKEARFVVFNALTQKRTEILYIRSTQPNIQILTEDGIVVPIQINPVWNITDNYDVPKSVHSDRIIISTRQYEIQFLATLDALSLTTFKIVLSNDFNKEMSTIYCETCSNSDSNIQFNMKGKPTGDIQLENSKMRLLFDEKLGFLKTVTRKKYGRTTHCAVKFAAYKSAQFHSGAYLFKTDPEQNEAEKDVLDQYQDVHIIITSGPITSDVTVVYGPFLAHTIRIFNTHTYIDNAIYIENDIDFEPPPKNRETELFMRFLTDIENGSENPEFFSDQNGFQFHKRVKIPAVGIEGNYFPITSAAFIQDKNVRLTLITSHAQGAASYEFGQLEVMLDRRTLYDDYRGMGEGIVDSKLTRHKFWLLIEEMPERVRSSYQVLSLTSNYFANGLRYPPNIYFVESVEMSSPTNLLSKTILLNPLPCDLHLLNLRTLSEEQLTIFPSRSSLLILHRQGFDCSMEKLEQSLNCNTSQNFDAISNLNFNELDTEFIESASLTGVQSRHKLRSFADIRLDPMDIKTFILTFKA